MNNNEKGIEELTVCIVVEIQVSRRAMEQCRTKVVRSIRQEILDPPKHTYDTYGILLRQNI